MDLRDFFVELLQEYDVTADFNSPGQQLLKSAPIELRRFAPPTLLLKSGGGQGSPTSTPWVAFLDPDETDSPQRGVFVFYLLAADKQYLNLSLNQGHTAMLNAYTPMAAREQLSAEAALIRRELVPFGVKKFSGPLLLSSDGNLQRSYVAANIARRQYDAGNLPPEKRMVDDLNEFLRLYERAIEAKRRILSSTPGAIETPSSPKTTTALNPLEGFRPRDSSDYRTTLIDKVLVATRRHEELVKNFGEHLISNGWEVTTPHPQDLMLKKGRLVILVEAQVVKMQNATDAVGAAVGQLFTYRHFLHEPSDRLKLLALFSGPIGDGYEEFLDGLHIGSVAFDQGVWKSSPLAASWGLSSL